MKRIVAISDLHGVLPVIESSEVIDYLLICGDIVPEEIEINPFKSRKWVENEFFEWCRQFRRVILIAGNHDFMLSLFGRDIRFPHNIVYLDNSYFEDGHVEIYGSTNMKIFGQIFGEGSDRMDSTYRGFADNGKLHIVMTHKPSRMDVAKGALIHSFSGHYHVKGRNLMKDRYNVAWSGFVGSYDYERNVALNNTKYSKGIIYGFEWQEN